jgi:hypothetical protein
LWRPQQEILGLYNIPVQGEAIARRVAVSLRRLGRHHSSTTAKQRIADANLDRPLRITGQMMFDGSHRPCANGSGSPKRVSVWEIHPVYASDVCNKRH